MCAGSGAPELLDWKSPRPWKSGLVPGLPPACSGGSGGGPFGCKGKRGCEGADCGVRPGPRGKGGPMGNIGCEGGFADVAGRDGEP